VRGGTAPVQHGAAAAKARPPAPPAAAGAQQLEVLGQRQQQQQSWQQQQQQLHGDDGDDGYDIDLLCGFRAYPGSSLLSLEEYSAARSIALKAAAAAGLQRASNSNSDAGCEGSSCSTLVAAAGGGGGGGQATAGGERGNGGKGRGHGPHVLCCSSIADLQAYTHMVQQLQQLHLQTYVEQQLGRQLLLGLLPGIDGPGRQSAGTSSGIGREALVGVRSGGCGDGSGEGAVAEFERRLAQYRLAHMLLRSGQKGVGLCTAVECLEEGA
jgi:hypothetical protein